MGVGQLRAGFQARVRPSDLSGGLSLNTVSVVTARIRPAYDSVPEIQFSVTKHASGEITVVVTTLRSPLQIQLQHLHGEYRSTAPSEIAKLVKADRFIVTKAQCPALFKIASAFEKLRPPIALENSLSVNPRQYQLWVDASSQQVYLNLLGASSGESGNPLIEWIEESRKRLERAIKESRMKAP